MTGPGNGAGYPVELVSSFKPYAIPSSRYHPITIFLLHYAVLKIQAVQLLFTTDD
jgi:hypothetical protein